MRLTVLAATAALTVVMPLMARAQEVPSVVSTSAPEIAFDGRNALDPPEAVYLDVSDALPGRVYKLDMDGKVLGGSADQASNSGNSAESIRSPAPPRTSSTSSNC